MNYVLKPDMYCVQLAEVPKLVNEYSELILTGVTEDWCRCEWVIHPDDVDITPGCCIRCGVEKGLHDATPPLGSFDHVFRGIRKRRGMENPECPVHTREGLLLGFFEWLIRGTLTTTD